MKKIIGLLTILLTAQAWMLPDAVDPVQRLREQIESFNRKYKRVKLDLLFNQPRYAPGDTALVRTLYLSARDLRPVSGREIVYIELFDQKGVRKVRHQVRVENGLASNAIAIPENLEPGVYQLVAYSDWMRNLDKSLFFQQELLITGKELIRIADPSGEAHLSFYPEGGSLIAGVENNLILLKSGGNKSAKVTIQGGSDSWGPVSFDAQELAEIKFTPQSNVSYTAIMESGGAVSKFIVPAALAEGFSVQTSASGDNGLRIKLQARARTTGGKYFLVLANSAGVAWSRSVDFASGGPFEVALPNDLPAGIADIILIDDNMKIWVRRLVMIPAKSDFTISLKTSRKEYPIREAGRIEIELLDRSGSPLQGTFAARIINQDLFHDTLFASASGNNLLLYSDIAPTTRMKGNTDLTSVNRYLATQTSPWLEVEEKSSGKQDVPLRYQPLNSMTISGTATFLETGEVLPDSTQLWFFLQKQLAGYEVTTGEDGSFNCPILFDFEGTDEVFYAAVRKGADLHPIALQWGKQDSVYGFKARSFIKTTKEDPFGNYRMQKKVIDKSYSFFRRDRQKTDSIADPNAAIEDELQGADVTLTINDFVLFPTMPDVIREVLKSVDYRKVRGRDVIRVYTTHKSPSNYAGPLYVIDGVMTKNPATFLNLKPADVLTIKVVKQGNKLMRFGTLGTNGVILVRTKNAGRKTMTQKEDTFPLTGMSPKYRSVELSPVSTDFSRPLMKPCLLWAPNEVLDGSGKSVLRFNTSDDVGNFKVQIEGITTTGKPFFAEESFQVKFVP